MGDPVAENPTQYMLEKAFDAAYLDWRFLTFDPAEDWTRVLMDYDQPTQPVEGEDGVFSHVLRVYLLDEDGNVRNIYTTSFLHADTLLSDIRTVLADKAADN